MELILCITLLLLVLLIGVIVTSKGECYYCGDRFERNDTMFKVKGKKTCYDCRSSF